MMSLAAVLHLLAVLGPMASLAVDAGVILSSLVLASSATISATLRWGAFSFLHGRRRCPLDDLNEPKASSFFLSF
jgi:hypothetical protein